MKFKYFDCNKEDCFENENYNHNVENYDRDLELDPRNEKKDEV